IGDWRPGPVVVAQHVVRLVDELLALLLRLLDLVLERGASAIGLALALEVLVVGQVAGGFLDSTLEIVLLALHCSLLERVTMVFPTRRARKRVSAPSRKVNAARRRSRARRSRCRRATPRSRTGLPGAARRSGRRRAPRASPATTATWNRCGGSRWPTSAGASSRGRPS